MTSLYLSRKAINEACFNVLPRIHNKPQRCNASAHSIESTSKPNEKSTFANELNYMYRTLNVNTNSEYAH